MTGLRAASDRLARGRGELTRPNVARALAFAITLGVAPAAHAQPTTDPAAAQSLFDAGRELMNAGDFAAACPKFEESNKLDPSAGTLLNLAKCLELSGKSASAWAVYNRTISLGRSTRQVRQVAAAEEAVAAIEPTLSKLVVEVTAPVPGLVVARDDIPVGQAALGVAIAVDPGRHTVRAEAPGYAPWSDQVEVESGATTVTVRVPALLPVATPPPPPRPETPPPPPPDGPSALLVAGLVTGGVGVVSLAVGAAFGAMTLSSVSAAQEDPALCPRFRCTPAGLEAIGDARTSANVSTGMLAVGGVAAATGAVLDILGWPTPERVSVSSWALPSGFGVVVGGTL